LGILRFPAPQPMNPKSWVFYFSILRDLLTNKGSPLFLVTCDCWTTIKFQPSCYLMRDWKARNSNGVRTPDIMWIWTLESVWAPMVPDSDEVKIRHNIAALCRFRWDDMRRIIYGRCLDIRRCSPKIHPNNMSLFMFTKNLTLFTFIR